MDPGLVSSLSGALAQSKRVELITNNLANADTPGFKSDDLIFEEALDNAHRADTRSDVPERPLTESELLSKAGNERRVVLYGSEYTDLHAGAAKQTANPLDVLIEGNGFLEVLTPDGVRLTRAGNLALDNQGRLVTRDGFLVLASNNSATPGQGGPEQATRAIQAGSGRINIDLEGNVYSSPETGGALVGKLSLVKVENPAALVKTGQSLFTSGPEAFVRPADRGPASVGGVGGGPKPNPLGAGQVRVKQGMLEGSNVNPITEMTKLIEAHRLFDQNTKLMQTQGDLSARVSEIGKY